MPEDKQALADKFLKRSQAKKNGTDLDPQAQLDRLLRRAQAEKAGMGDVFDHVEKIKPLMEKINSLQDTIRGDQGETGEPGVDGGTGPMGMRGLQGDQGLQGIEGVVGEKGEKGDRGFKGEKGDKGDAGVNTTPKDVVEHIKGLQGEDAASFSKRVGGAIDISHIRNAQSFIFNKTKYEVAELMHSGGGGMTIGGAVMGGTAPAVLFIGPGNVLAQDPANFAYDPLTKKLTVTGPIDPTSVTLSDPALAAFYASSDGSVAPVSVVNTGRLRYNTLLQQWEESHNTSPYAPFAGNVSTVSVVSVNGFAGTVATPTTTPAITITTTQTGVLFGNGTAITGIVDGIAGQQLTTNGAGVYTWQNAAPSAWQLLGNAGTVPGVNFLGTTGAQDVCVAHPSIS